MFTAYRFRLAAAPFNGNAVTKWMSAPEFNKFGGYNAFIPAAGATVETTKVNTIGDLCDLNA